MKVPFSPQSDDSPVVPIFVCLLLYLGCESDGAHNTITEFLVQNGFVRIPIILNDFVKSVDQWLLWRHLYRMTSDRKPVREVPKIILAKLKYLGQVLDIIRRCFNLTIEYPRHSYFISSQFIGDILECKIFDRFGLEDLGGVKATKGALSS